MITSCIFFVLSEIYNSSIFENRGKKSFSEYKKIIIFYKKNQFFVKNFITTEAYI